MLIGKRDKKYISSDAITYAPLAGDRLAVKTSKIIMYKVINIEKDKVFIELRYPSGKRTKLSMNRQNFRKFFKKFDF